jgi:hypothetical protein
MLPFGGEIFTMRLRDIQKAIRSLNLEQTNRLRSWLDEHSRGLEEAARAKRMESGREVLEERQIDNKTYRLEKVRCGKENCRCAQGDLHGPYYYAYWSEEGKTRTQYIGKKLPQKGPGRKKRA